MLVAGKQRVELIIDDGIYISILGATSPPEACDAESLDCPNYYDQIGLEAIRSLHRQLDDDDNGDIDLSESDDVRSFKFTSRLFFQPFCLFSFSEKN